MKNLFDISNTRITLYTARLTMIILHSMKILEQLTEIENLIKKIQSYLDENGIEADQEKILEALIASRKLD